MSKILLMTYQPPPLKGASSRVLYRLFKKFPLLDYFFITLGAIIMALGISVFLIELVLNPRLDKCENPLQSP